MRGLPQGSVDDLWQAHADGTGATLKPFLELGVDHEEAGRPETSWHKALITTLARLKRERKWNRIQTVATAVSVTLQLAFDIEVRGLIVAKLVVAAQKQQQLEVSRQGKKPTETMTLRSLHIFIVARARQLGSLERVSELELRTWGSTGLRMLAGGRPEDPTLLLEKAAQFIGGERWRDATTARFRLRGAKDTNPAASMSREAARKPAERAVGAGSSVITAHNPFPGHQDFPIPDYFAIVDEYLVKRVRRRGAPTCTVQHPDPKIGLVESNRLFLGARAGKKHRHREPSRSTFSGATQRLLIQAGITSAKGPLKSEHIRHSTLPHVHHRRPKDFDIALARSRHKRSTFHNAYEYPLSEGARVVLMALPGSCPIEWVFLG